MGNVRLSARPRTNLNWELPAAGVHKLELPNARGRDGAIFIPSKLRFPAPVMVMLHGAGGSSAVISLVSKQAEQQGVIVVAPVSQGSSWDMISGGDFGPDVQHIDKVLSSVFQRFPVDSARLAVAGFSDGASYALSLGVGNGDLFPCVLAFSPGFMRDPIRFGKPRIYVSHGKLDNVLEIDRCSRRLVPRLQGEGYEVKYTEFDGGHTVPASVVEEGLESLLH